MSDPCENCWAPFRILYAMLWPILSILLGIVAGTLMSVVITIVCFLITLVRTPLHMTKMLYDTIRTKECFQGHGGVVMRIAVLICVPVINVLFLVGITAFCAIIGPFYYIGRSTKVFYNHEYLKTWKKIESNARLEPKSYLGKYIKTCQDYMADDQEGSNDVLFAIKGIFAAIPGLVIASAVFAPFTLAIVAITLYRLPINVYKTTKIAMWTVVLQWDLRVVVLILIPFVHTIFPAVVFVIALLFAFFWAWIKAACNIFDGKFPLDGFYELRDFVQDYHQRHKAFVSNEEWGRYDHPTGIPLGWDGTSYGLEIERILRWQRDFFICCVLVLLQLPICLVATTLSGAVNYIPTCLFGWKNYLKESCCADNIECVSILGAWPFHLLVLVLLPFGILICHVFGIVYSGILRVLFEMPWEYLVNHKGLFYSWKIQFRFIIDHDKIFQETGGIQIYKCLYSMMANESPGGAQSQRQLQITNNGQTKNVTTYWDRFVSQCIRTTSLLIEQSWIDFGDIQTMEPSVIQSIPAVAILKILVDSIKEKGLKQGDIKWDIDGTVCQESSMSTSDGIKNHLWPMVRDLKLTLKAHENTLLTKENLDILTAMLCTNSENDSPKCKDAQQKIIESTCRSLNNSIRTKINRLVLAILRVKPYQERMQSIFKHKYSHEALDIEMGTGYKGMGLMEVDDTMESIECEEALHESTHKQDDDSELQSIQQKPPKDVMPSDEESDTKEQGQKKSDKTQEL